MNIEAVLQTGISQGTTEPIEVITPEECSRKNMNTEEVFLEENREASPTEGTAAEEQTPAEKLGSEKGTVIPLRKRKSN